MSACNRRTFLKQTAAFTALIGSFSKSHLIQAALSQPEYRDFEMLVLGDSIMWGQGLQQEHKFTYLVKKWLSTNLSRPVRMRVEAHSGATIEADASDGDACTQGYYGEINRSAPTIPKQIELAAEHYRQDEIANEAVDFVILDGGINDISKLELLWPKTSPEKIRDAAWLHCGDEMCNVLNRVASAFPRARILVVGYFPLITANTPPHFLRNALQVALGHKSKADSLYHEIESEAGKSAEVQKNGKFQRLVQLSKAWKEESDRALGAAVAEINRTRPLGTQGGTAESKCKLDRNAAPTVNSSPAQQRAAFASVAFGEDNGYGVPEHTYLWELVSAQEKLQCPNHSILSWLAGNLITNDEVWQDRSCRCIEAKRSKLVCVRAATFHPNRSGAQAYYRTIVEHLEPLLPLWTVRNH